MAYRCCIPIEQFGDFELFVALLVIGLARWEFFAGDDRRGEVCVGGLRYSTELDSRGLPVIYPGLRQQMIGVLKRQRGEES